VSRQLPTVVEFNRDSGSEIFAFDDGESKKSQILESRERKKKKNKCIKMARACKIGS